jgi:hypothetical protein
LKVTRGGIITPADTAVVSSHLRLHFPNLLIAYPLQRFSLYILSRDRASDNTRNVADASEMTLQPDVALTCKIDANDLYGTFGSRSFNRSRESAVTSAHCKRRTPRRSACATVSLRHGCARGSAV